MLESAPPSLNNTVAEEVELQLEKEEKKMLDETIVDETDSQKAEKQGEPSGIEDKKECCVHLEKKDETILTEQSKDDAVSLDQSNFENQSMDLVDDSMSKYSYRSTDAEEQPVEKPEEEEKKQDAKSIDSKKRIKHKGSFRKFFDRVVSLASPRSRKAKTAKETDEKVSKILFLFLFYRRKKRITTRRRSLLRSRRRRSSTWWD